MLRFIVGVLIIVGGLVVFGASAVRGDNLGLALGVGFMFVGAFIGASGGDR